MTVREFVCIQEMPRFSETSRTVASASFVVVDGVTASTGFPLLAPNGTPAAPSYSFAADTSAGLFASLQGDMGVSVGGATSWMVSPGLNTTLGGDAPTSYGGGEGVTFVPDAVTNPTGAPNGGSGGVLYVDGSTLNYMDNLGVSTDISRLAGDVTGPGAATDDSAVRFDGTTGKLLRDSTMQIDAANVSVLLGATPTPAGPPYSFLSDPTIGMYRAGANSLGLSVGGVKRVQVDTTSTTFTTPIRLIDGTAVAPALQLPAGGVRVEGNDLVVTSGGVDVFVAGPDENTAFGGGVPTNYGGTTSGEGVVLLHPVSAAPTGATTGGMSLYSDGTDVLAMTPAGATPLNLSGCIQGNGSSGTLQVVRFDGDGGKTIKDTSSVNIGGSGRLSIPDGSAAAPGFSFEGDTGTGAYQPTNNEMGIASQGVQNLNLTPTILTSIVPALYSSGSAATPGVALTLDTNTGLFLDGSSPGMAAGGAAGLVVSPDANVSLAGGEAGSYGGGQGVMFINQATTDPTTNPTLSGLLYVPVGDVDALAYRDTAGTVTTLTDTIETSNTATDNSIMVWEGTSGEVVRSSSLVVTDTGEMRAEDGVLSAPAYSFVGDTDTGMYRSAENVLDIVAGGARAMSASVSAVTFDSTVDTPDGTAGAPSLTFESALSLGMFRAGADTVSFVAGGAARFTATLPSGAGAPSVTLGSANVDYGSGEGVVLLDDVSVAPTGTAATGGRLYVSGTSLNYHDTGGGVVDLGTTALGPATTTTGAIARFDGTGGRVLQDSGLLVTGVSQDTLTAPVSVTPTFAFTASPTTGVHFPTATTIGLSTAGVERVTMGEDAVVVGVDVQADAGLEIGGGTGVEYTLAGANAIANVQDAAGSFAWRNTNGPIMFTSGLDLAITNQLLFTQGTESLGVGRDGDVYTLDSTGASPDDLVVDVGGTDILRFNAADDADVTGLLLSSGRVAGTSTSTSTSAYTFAASGGIDRGMTLASPNSIQLGLGATAGVAVVGGSKVVLGRVADSPSANGSGCVLLSTVGTVPTAASSGGSELVVYNEVASGVYGLGAVNAAGTQRTILDGFRERATITLSSFTVTTGTSTNTDGQAWSAGDAHGVNGTTTGEMATADDAHVGLTVSATWASNSTGHRRVTIMRKTAGPTYTKVAGVIAMAVNGDVTAQSVSFFGALTAATDELSVQVEHSAGADLDLDLVASFVRYTTAEVV